MVTTGVVSRTWMLTPCGLETTNLSHSPTNRSWELAADGGCDWSIFALTSGRQPGELIDVALRAVPQDNWTSPHVEALLTFRYPTGPTELRYRVWAYPGAQGMRTQIGLRWAGAPERKEAPTFLGGSWVESLRLDPSELGRRAAGYYNDTQHRNYDDTRLLREVDFTGPLTPPEDHDWANLLRLSRGDGAGLTLVKESHKCVNQAGVDTGSFVADRAGVRVTGLGLPGRAWHEQQQFDDGWATWLILHGADEDAASLALKQFDRVRFPLDPNRDLYAMANTWGSGGAGWRSRAAATQENILRELEVAADLHLDGVQIDDGWQCPPGDPPKPFDVDWSLPDAERFPDGWKVVREKAEQLGIALGLWAPARVDADQLIRALRDGRFRCLKLDFMHLHNWDVLQENVGKARQLIQAVDGPLRINWDVTENAPRVGYFYARDCGCIFLANRENGPSPWRSHVHIRHTPRLTLRETWELARHLNLNQFQITFQNKDLVEPDVTNVQEYSHGYLLAMTLMALPVFFQEVQKLSPEARDEIRPIMKAYQQHRLEMNRGYVFPIGDEPDDHQWSGFQSHDPQTESGYLLVFRELHNIESEKRLRLPLLAGRELHMTNVLTGEATSLPCENTGFANFSLPEPGTFIWTRYEPA
jgi:hypothetical protein